MLELYSQPDMAWHAVCDRIDGCTRLSIRVPLGMPMTTKVISETEMTFACPGGPGDLSDLKDRGPDLSACPSV